MHEALDDPAVREVVARKSSQVAWTDGVLLNYIGRRIDIDPCPMIVMFAKDDAAKQFNDEKLVPMVEVTPRLAAKLPVHRLRDRDNRAQFKSFAGGFLKLVSSRSPSSVKSTPVPVVAVEEPDDAESNLRGQGDSVAQLVDRTKTFPRPKVIYGGTPTVEGLSRIDAAYRKSDQRQFWVPCHHCGESHVLHWDNVRWLDDAPVRHEVLGTARPETATYSCPHCGAIWTDAEKNRNVRKAKWIAAQPFRGVAGFYINELYSPFPGSKLAALVEKYLIAQHELEQGDDKLIRAFTNGTLGLAYAYRTELPDADRLRERSEAYAEGTVPHGGLLLSAGVDVQHDRIAVVVRAWGRGEESWLVLWTEIYGPTLVPHQGPWLDLEQVLFERVYRHASGAAMSISATTLDTSDGQTSDAGYAFVRKWAARNVVAGKGGSDTDSSREIFSPPRKSVDTDRTQKAWKYGLRPFIVGVQRAKDLILGVDAKGGRLKLTGSGPGRMHWYAGVRDDYFAQLLAEIKAPSAKVRNRKVWQKKAGQNNEALDCEVYALHAARACKTHLMREVHWQALEARLKQGVLLVDEPEQHEQHEQHKPSPAQPAQTTEAPVAAAVPPAPPPAKSRWQVLSRGLR